jgi:hypothetical protein
MLTTNMDNASNGLAPAPGPSHASSVRARVANMEGARPMYPVRE